MERLNEANKQLPVVLRLGTASNYLTLNRTRRHLRIFRSNQELTLSEVEPVVTHESYLRGDSTVERGLDVRLPQRCDSIAADICAQHGVEATGERVYFEVLADVLGALPEGSDARKIRKNLAEARRDAAREGGRGEKSLPSTRH